MAGRMVVSDTDPLAKRVKEMSGRPYGLVNLTPNRELWAALHEDDTINVDELRAAGMPDSEIVMHRFPLLSHLMGQAGRSYDDQAKEATRLVERAMRARDAGRTPKPPQRQTGLNTPELKPLKEF